MTTRIRRSRKALERRSTPLWRLRLLVWAGGGLALASGHAGAAEVTVAAAASLEDAMKQIGPAFAASTGGKDHAVFNFGASSALARQIASKAPVDVFVSADEANMDKLAAAHLLAPGSRQDIVGNELVLIVHASDGLKFVTKPADLLDARIKHVALCDPAVPVGHYGRELLRKLGLEERLAPKLANPEHVRATLALVASGGADAGFVYRTDVEAAATKVKIVYTAPAAKELAIRYPAAVVVGTKVAAAANAFVAFLGSQPARAVFLAHGFTKP